MERQTRKSIRTRATLLEAARQTLVETGDLRMAQVSRIAGVSEGLPFTHFGSRSGLLVAVLEQFYGELDEEVIYKKFDGATWEDRERKRVAAWTAFLFRHPLARVILTGLTGDAEVARASEEALRRAITVGALNMSTGQEAGELPTDRDPELMAAAALGAVHAMVATALGRDVVPEEGTVGNECWAAVQGLVGLT